MALRAVVHPYVVRGVESTRRMLSQLPPGAQWAGFVAEVDGELCGWVSAYRNTFTSTADAGDVARLHVHPDRRHRGAGSALAAAALGHLRAIGVHQVHTSASAEALGFARRFGFVPTRAVHYSALRVELAPATPITPDGVRLAALTELDPLQLYTAHVIATADEPRDFAPDEVDLDTWRYEVWDNVGLEKAASVAAVRDGEIVAFSLVKRDGDRMWSDMTATVPSERGRGLARLVKCAALHRAAERGVRVAYTSNDEHNAPMLAVNAALGYRPITTEWACRATLT